MRQQGRRWGRCPRQYTLDYEHDSYESMTIPVLTTFVAYAQTSSCEEEEFHMDLESSTEETALSSTSVISTPRLAPEERLKTTTLGLTEWDT
ncbi:unnamed protein product [Haemonchus placei]|uniref:ORF3 n=1 Tax=Haemonchus placei TaxID=6290 RepID=A0A0N4WAK0_HAEPC|nr:unnamed protein product [Haemonchus placei]